MEKGTMRKDGAKAPKERVIKETSEELENIEKSSSVAVTNGREAIYCLSVIGQIEGHYYLPEGAAGKQHHHFRFHPVFAGIQNYQALWIRHGEYAPAPLPDYPDHYEPVR